MARDKEYLLSINKYNEPAVLYDKEAIGILLTRIIMLKKGSDPLHPDMGVDIESYRYGMGNLDELKSEITRQIQTYLPDYQGATVELIINEDKTINIEIGINNVVYVYDSSTAAIPITLSDIENN